MKKEAEPIGPDWFTLKQYGERYGIGQRRAGQKLDNDSRFEKWTGYSRAAKRVLNKFRLK